VITTINFLRLKNEQHVKSHESVLSPVEHVTPQTLGIEPLYSLYRQAFDSESEAMSIIIKNELTAQISEQDRVRDQIFRGFSNAVKSFRNHFDPDCREAANRLWNVFLHYGNIAQKPLDAETAAINDILREFQRPDLQQAMAKLEVQGCLHKLDEENRKFHQLMMQRYSEPAGRTTHRMKTARVETDKFFRAIASKLNTQRRYSFH